MLVTVKRMHTPGYTRLIENGELESRVKKLNEMLTDCVLCPHQCSVNRLEGEPGYCRTLRNPVVSSAQPHFGEEDELVGIHGSGTIFFSHCNLKCSFCQNYEISYCGEGRETSVEQLANIMLELKKSRCHNINLVSPSHIVPQIVEAIYIAARKGLDIPIVYNTGGYDLLDTLKYLDGIIDIYMPDIKFADNRLAGKYIGVKEYYDIARNAVKEMHRQVGDLRTDHRGIAYKGLIIRHLVLPHNLAGTGEIMKFISGEISKDTYVNIMAQYYPAHRARNYPELADRITGEEYENALAQARDAGISQYS